MYTFLFSDVEGSTRLLQRLGDAAPAVMARHFDILRATVAEHDGTVDSTAGDSVFAWFRSPTAAVAAAVAIQQRLAAEPWPADGAVQVRIGLHTGEVFESNGEFVGLDVHRAARIMSAGWGGQILLSAATAGLVTEAEHRLVDLGVHRLKDLTTAEHIYQVVVPGLRSDFPALRSLDTTPGNLPTPLTSFVGRGREVAEVKELLATTRALTLTGPGGTGKTRLALQVATDVADGYTDGAFFTPLASVTDPALVMSSVADVLGLTNAGAQTPLEVVTDHLARRRVLLLLDNFEQVLAAAAEVSKLLASAPGVTVLVTSRAPLRISGEQEYPVPPLGVPGPPSARFEEVAGSEAAALFVARAASTRPDFALTADNAADVAAIIRHVDGLPLAIELAAARVRVLPVRAIAERLGTTLDLLSSDARDVPDRQRTLRAAIAWSYELLDEPSRRLFSRLSVFRGGADFEHIERVCGPGLGADVFEAVTTLVDHSLVHRRRTDTGRFGMLETIREFAEECFSEREERNEIRRRHMVAFLDLATAAQARMTGPDSGQWLDRLERDHDNLRAALRRAVDSGETGIGLRLASALWRMWQIRGHLHEARRNLEKVTTLSGAAEHPAEFAAASEAAGGVAYWQGDMGAARNHYERSLQLYRSLGDDPAVARGLYNLAFTFGLDDPTAAHEVFERALQAYQRLGDEIGIAKVHWGMSVGALWSRDYEAVLRHTAHCIPVFRAHGQTFDLAWALHMKGLGELAFANYGAARESFEECLDMFLASDDASGYYLALADFALMAESMGDGERALRIFGAVERIGDETGSNLLEPQMKLLPRARRAEDAFEGTTVARLLAEGRAMSRAEAIAYARQR